MFRVLPEGSWRGVCRALCGFLGEGGGNKILIK
jgi:hypothetical protein